MLKNETIRHKMVKGWVGAKHQHPHEQMVYVVSGRIILESPIGKVEAAGGDVILVGLVPGQSTSGLVQRSAKSAAAPAARARSTKPAKS